MGLLNLQPRPATPRPGPEATRSLPVAKESAADCAELLRVWFHPGVFAPGKRFIEIATVPPKDLGGFASSNDAATGQAMSCTSGNIYFGLHPRAGPRGSGKLGTGCDVDVAGFAGLAVDSDFGHGNTFKATTADDLLALVRDRLPEQLQPSAIVHSGYGLWFYWPFAELLQNGEIDAYKMVGERLRTLLRGDSIYDARRIARCPGTLNRRKPETPVLARLLHANDRQFALDDFSALLNLDCVPRHGSAPSERQPSDWLALLRNGVGEGNRNTMLARFAGLLLGQEPLQTIVAGELIHCINEARFRPPLSAEEVEGVIDSIARREAKKLRDAAAIRMTVKGLARGK